MAKKVDQNQSSIVEALRKMGASVVSLHEHGGGVPDLLVGMLRQNYLIEIKTEKGTFTRDQVDFYEKWRGSVVVLRSVDDAVKWVSSIRGK